MKKLLLALFTVFTLQSQAQCWQEIKFGLYYTIGIKSDGTLWGWGANANKQLGDGTTVDKTSPVQIGADTDWKTVATGIASSVVLKTNGTIWKWGNGSNSLQQVGTDTDWKSISTSGYHVLAIKNNGTLWVWGDNGYGSLGLGNTQDVLVPTQLGTADDWGQISAGLYSSYAIKTDGTLWAWGSNTNGQMGNGTETGNDAGGPNVLTPSQIGVAANWKAVCAGGSFVVAQKTDNTLWSWGINGFGELGDGTMVSREYPLQIGDDNTWTSFTAGNGSCAATKADGTLYKWGQNEINFGTTQPTKVNTDTDWSSAPASGQAYGMGVKTNGDIYVWGKNQYGQLGLGDTSVHLEATFFGTMCIETAGLNNHTITQISLYPNPTASNLTLANAENLNIESLTVTDMTGKVVLTQNNNTAQINVEKLPAGMYFLNVSASEGSQHLKFVKE